MIAVIVVVVHGEITPVVVAMRLMVVKAGDGGVAVSRHIRQMRTMSRMAGHRCLSRVQGKTGMAVGRYLVLRVYDDALVDNHATK